MQRKLPHAGPTGPARSPENAPSGRTVGIAQWWSSSGRRLKRTWPRRPPGGREGLTRTQAEARLRDEIAATPSAARVTGERPAVATVAARYVAHARHKRRKDSTIENVESEVRVHLAPFFGDRALDAIDADDVADLISALEVKGLAPKSVRNIVGTLSALFNFAKAPRRRWATSNPCEGAELPGVDDNTTTGAELDQLDRLIAHACPGMYQALDATLYLVAAMTGLRLGELAALRWRDVDWTAMQIRVVRNYVRKRYGSPKSRRSSRAVPMAPEVGGVLDRLFQASAYQGDDDLVFAHPLHGGAITKANVTRRVHRALADAQLPDHVFHDLRHTFGTQCASRGVPMRKLQEWMGHKHISTTQRYAAYAPSGSESEIIEAVFDRPGRSGFQLGSNVSESQEPERT